MVRYRRLSSSPPPERELLTVDDDGGFLGWRSRGAVVGRFEGRLPDLDPLRAVIERSTGEPAPTARELPFDAAIERIEAGGREASTRAGDSPPGAWGDLLAWCRGQLGAMTADPVAAIAVSFAAPGTVRLEHRGTAILPLELASLSVELGRWRDGVFVDAVPADTGGLGRVEAGPGWSIEVAVPSPEAAPGDQVVASVQLVVEDRGIYVPVLCTASRAHA